MLNAATKATDLAMISRLAKALGHPKRVAILDALMQGVQCNCEISSALGMADNLVSHHLRILEESGLVRSERDPVDARWIYYSVNPQALAQVREALDAFLDPTRIRPRLSSCGPASDHGCAAEGSSPCR